MKKVLMIAYSFPPRGGSGVQRTVKFAKYLREFGWEPIILTVKNPPMDEPDRSLLEELPDDTKIFRTISIEPHRLFGNNSHGSGGNGAPKTFSFRTKEGWRNIVSEELFHALISYIGTWLFIPDRLIGWFPFGIHGAVRITKKYIVDVVYSTSYPFTGHLIGYVLKRTIGIPWIADFRDPWTHDVLLNQHRSKQRQGIDELIERNFLASADKVVVTCRPLIRLFLEKHSTIDSHKFVEITNGFDPDDFDSISNTSNFTGKLVITYTGRFNGAKTCSPAFFEAVKMIIDEKAKFANTIQVVIVGAFREDSRRVVRALGLENVVNFVGYVGHRESIRYMLKSDMLLLTLNNGPGCDVTYPGKLFEYLAARKPILALVTEGATAELVRSMQAGIVVPPDDVLAIRDAIYHLYQRHMQGNLKLKSPVALDMFDRRNLTRALADCLDELTERRMNL